MMTTWQCRCLSARDFPLVLQGNPEGDSEGIIQSNSDPQSENDGEDNKGEGKSEREGQDAHKVVGATTLGL